MRRIILDTKGRATTLPHAGNYLDPEPLGCEDNKQTSQAPQNPSEDLTEAPATVEWKGYAFGDFANLLAPLIDPAKLDTLKGKRAATPRLRKACYWLQMAHISGFDAGEIIDQAHAQTGPHEPKRA